MISSSGMASGGRVLHHLHRRLADPSATVIFAGFQVAETLGHEIVSGARHVSIFGDRLTVRAQIDYFDGLSAHAGKSELLRWIGTLGNKPRFYAVHGEPAASQALCDAVHERLGLDAGVALRNATIEL